MAFLHGDRPDIFAFPAAVRTAEEQFGRLPPCKSCQDGAPGLVLIPVQLILTGKCDRPLQQPADSNLRVIRTECNLRRTVEIRPPGRGMFMPPSSCDRVLSSGSSDYESDHGDIAHVPLTAC